MTRIYQTWPVRDTGDGNIEECLPKDANNWAVYWREGGEGPATWLADAHNEWLADDLVEALNNLEPANVPQPIQPTLNSQGTACFSPAQTWLPIDEATPVGVKIQLINKNANVAQYGSLTGKPGFWTHWAPLPAWAAKTS